MGAGMGAETTAAATGAVGVVRRDPMAMLPFCGYNMADYFAHWLAMGKRMKKPPLIFRVNWFRKGADGKFLWPGYGENIRVLLWILERLQGKGNAQESPVGFLPAADAIRSDGISLVKGAMGELTGFDKAGWANGVNEIARFFMQFGDRLPADLWREHKRVKTEIEKINV
jgi:phosphoenolpyruvate carboxykinase (GTP)